MMIRGRAGLMGALSGYGDNIRLESSDGLVVHRTQDRRVVVLEYAVHGKIVATNVPYDFASSDRLVTSTIAQVVKDQIDIGYGVHRCRGAHRSHIRCNESDEEQRQAGRPRGVRAD